MAQIESRLTPGSEAFRAQQDGMLALIDRVRSYQRRAVEKSAASRPRFDKRSQLLPRERLSLLLDPGTPFLELSQLAGLGLDNPDLDKSVPGGGLIAGIGIVSGVRCMVNASDSGIDAGALQPMGLDKPVLTLEAMKMEHVHAAPVAGTVSCVHAAVGDQVPTGRVLVEIDADTAVAVNAGAAVPAGGVP